MPRHHSSIYTGLPGMKLRDHTFSLPLDYSGELSGDIEVYLRELVSVDNKGEELPYLLFLQGGPGLQSPRPLPHSGFLKEATKNYKVLLLDQRGVGRSTRFDADTAPFADDPKKQAAYLRCFCADSIVKDAEEIRKILAGPETPWAVLGQSFGGFCLTHYLSTSRESISEGFFTGGLPPINTPLDEIYRKLLPRVIKRNERLREQFPQLKKRTEEVFHHLSENEVHLPRGGKLTVRRLKQLGILLGYSYGAATLSYLFEEPFVAEGGKLRISRAFLTQYEDLDPFDKNPLYWLLHESIYCEGNAPRWSAARVQEEFPEFTTEPIFTGETVYPWMGQEYARLQSFGETAELLANYSDWRTLYSQEELSKVTSPTAAILYSDDMYVDRDLSEKTAESLKGLKTWVTNEYDHDGVRKDGERVFSYLFDLVKGRR